MSITRIVEGDLINTSTAMNLTANAGDYEFSTPMKNQWKGEADGVVESDYKASNKEDTLSNAINVKLNLFFDGTQNNKTNTEARMANSPEYQEESDKEDSYENDFTNVARGYDAVNPDAENQIAVYIEGIGTEDLKSDSVVKGVAMGMGDTGVPAKVAIGCKKAAKSISAEYSGKDIDFLYVNVYGFSRGAAAARHFIHVASTQANYLFQRFEGKKKLYIIKGEFQPQFKLALDDTSFIDNYGYFGACLLEKGMKIKKIIFNFVGIYDTVASYGVAHFNDVSDLDLNSVHKANYVFHLVSDDEYRDNFDLSNIDSAGLNGLELTLPGVHSDIGGSYLNEVTETSVIDCITVGGYYKERTESPHDEARRRKDPTFDSFKKRLVEEGWYQDGQLKKEFFENKDFKKNVFFLDKGEYYGLVGRRKLYNTYDKIPLDMMVEKSKYFKVEYKAERLEDYKIKDSFINNIYNQIKEYYNASINVRNSYVNKYNKELKNFDFYSKNYLKEIKQVNYANYVNWDDLHQLRNNYLHWSVKSSLTGLSGRIKGDAPQHERKREIHNG
jgi:hypothetical protein